MQAGIIDFLQSLADGVLFGTTYAIIGIGFTLIFGVMHKLNLSFAAASIGGAYLSLALLAVWRAPSLVLLATSAAGGAALGVLVFLSCFRFIRADNALAPLMATVGMLLLIDEAIAHLTAGVPLRYPALFPDVMLDVGPMMVRSDLLFVFAIGCVATSLLMWLLYRTRVGIATRAVAQRPVAAALCGIGIGRVNATTFALAGALGGVAGALTGTAVGVLSPLLTLPITVKGLIVTVIGGLGSIPGAILAGLLVGGFENIIQHFRGVSERDLHVMLLLFAFLVFRPGGLFAPPAGRD